MKKTISDVINFPNDCESVRYIACFVSMLMRAEGMTGIDSLSGSGVDERIRALQRKHCELYNLYTAVSGFGFLQLDLSNNGHMAEKWNQTNNVMLREFDWYIGFAMDFAGYDFEELISQQEEKDTVFSKIKSSIDRDIPVLALFGRLYQWVLITGYDDEGTLYGYDGSQGYWGAPCPKPAGYDENGLFIMPNWYELGGHSFLLGDKKKPSVSLRDVFLRGIRILEDMNDKGFYQNSAEFMRKDLNFENLNDGELLCMRERISRWIGQPIDQRAILGYAMNQLGKNGLPDKEQSAINAVHRLCRASHDVLWIAWRAIGEFMEGDRLSWAKGLQNKTIRLMIADCFQMVCDHDRYMLEELKAGFQ